MTKPSKPTKDVTHPAAAPAFEDDVLAELLTRTENGEPLTRICEDARMPKRRTVYDWLEQDGEFAAQFRAARARGIHALAEDTLRIADEPSKDAVEVADKRVRIDTRLRLAGKWLPSVYGEKVTQEHTGAGGGPILYAELSDDELDNRIARLAAQA